MANSHQASLSLTVKYLEGLILIDISMICDINGDNTINIQDIIIVINIILGELPIQDSADLNQDGLINILDILQLINIILS